MLASPTQKGVLKIAGPDPVGECDLVRQRPYELLRLKDALIKRARRRADLALAMLARGPWDLFVLNFSEAHCAGHQLWATRDPNHPQYQRAFRSVLGEDPLLEVYQAIDHSVGRVIDVLGNDAFLMVLATHGMGPRYDANAALDSILRRLDRLADSSTSQLMESARYVWLYQLPLLVRKTVGHLANMINDAPRQYERAPRRFFAVPTTDNCGGVRINLQGREPKGLVEPGSDYQELCDWLEDELLSLVNARTGAPAAKRVLHGDHLFAGPFRNDFPDLVIEWNQDAPIPAVRSPHIGEVDVESINPRTGDHRPMGLVLARSKDLAPHVLEGDISIVDLAPTLAARLGVEFSGIDGKPIRDFLRGLAHT